ncbi:ead/Ea22-like family protein [Escherichia coli]|nr:ead/Ea22-like family protein [Escherichia coli]
MSETNYQELREAAEQATQDEWVAYILPGHNGIYPARTSEGRHCGYFIDWPGTDGQRNASANARYIAAIPPKVALDLLGEIKRLEDKNIDAMCQIAELESNRAALAAENAALKQSEKEFNNFCRQEYYGWEDNFTETPATDALLAEVRAQGVDMARNAMIDFVDGEVGPNKNVPGLIRGAEICVSIAEQLRKGGNQ